MILSYIKSNAMVYLAEHLPSFELFNIPPLFPETIIKIPSIDMMQIHKI